MAENFVRRINYEPIGGANNASGIAYDNTNSTLTAVNVQEAVDDLDQKIIAETTRASVAEAALIPLAQRGAANGVATLDAGGLVPAAQLPSYVDDILEFANLATFPGTGETGKIYIALDTNFSYRWSGSAYIQINVSPVASVFTRTGAVVAVSGDYTASQVTNVPAGNLAATNIQTAVNELQGDIDSIGSSITNHIANATGAHAASAIANTPSGNLAGINVQTALNELQSDIDTRALDSALTNHINSTTAHAADDITYDGTLSGLVATKVQGAIDELANRPTGSAGDINETSFSLANNQVSPASVTGFTFDPLVVRSFDALVSVEIDASTPTCEVFKISGIQNATDFLISIESSGSDSGVLFNITTIGQITYTSTSNAGFVSGAIKYRAISTSV